MSEDTDWNPPDLAAFAAHLRTAGFRVGAGEVLRCTALLERLRRLDRAPTSREDLVEWLSPLLCSSAQEQHAFGRLLLSFERKTGRCVDPPPPPSPAPSQPAAREPLPRALKLALVGLAILMVLASWMMLPQRQIKGPGTHFTPPNAQTAPTVIEEPTGPRVVVYGILGRVLLCGAPLLAWLVLWRTRRARESALMRADSKTPDAARLSPWDHGLRLFDLDSARQVEARAGPSAPARDRLRALSDGLRYAMEGLRVRRQVVACRIDARASARATANHGGLPRLVWRRRSAKADYPLLIDTRSGRDHLLVLGRAFSARMQRAGIEHTRYLFGGDPRALREDRPNTRFHSLEAIGASFNHATLIVIGTGDFLEETTSLRDGARGSLVAVLAQWQRVVLLTPLPRHQWTWRERRIEGLGIVVLPLTPEELRTLGDRLRVNPGESPPRRSKRVAAPSALSNEQAWSTKWHSDATPGEDDREELLDAIALALPPIGLEWLGVLALFPELRPELTLHVATTLRQADGAMAVDEADYAALCALPWLRAGRMPDWLRLEIVRTLSPQALARAHRVLEEWLVRVAGDASSPEGAIPLKITMARERFREQIGADPSSPYRDAIFLRFLEGGELHTLDLKAPVELFERVAQEQALLERRSGVAAIAVAAVLLAGSLVLASAFGSFEVTPVHPLALLATLLIAATLRGFADAAADVPQRIAAGIALAALPALGLLLLAARYRDPNDGANDFFLSAAVLPAIALSFRPTRPKLPPVAVDARRHEASDVGGATLCLLAAVALKAFDVGAPSDELQGVAWLGLAGVFAFGLAWIYAGRFAAELHIVALHAISATLLLVTPLAFVVLGLSTANADLMISRWPLVTPSWYIVVPLAAGAGCIAAVGARRQMAWRPPLTIGLLAIVAVLAAFFAVAWAPLDTISEQDAATWLAGLAVLPPMLAIAGLGLDKPERLGSRSTTLPAALALIAGATALVSFPSPNVLWLIVPWLALPLTLAWRMLREERPPTLRDALRAFVPPPAFAWLAGMWLSALGNTLLARTAGAAHDLHSPSIAVLTVPLTVLLARSSRPPSWPLVCLGVLPMCVPLPKTMGSLNFGIALSCLAIYGLLTSAAARDLLRSLSASTWQRLLPPMLILGLEFQVRYREAGASLIDAAVLLVVLCGVVRVRRLVAIGAILVVAVLAALAQGWDLDGVLVFDCVTPVTGILLLEWSRRLSALDWDLRALSSGRAGARRGLAWTACAGIGLLACAWGENAIGMALCGVKLNYMLTKEVWGPDAATLLAFASFAFGIAFERFSIGRRERMTGAPGLAMVISYTLLSPPWFAALVALVPVAFVVAGATSNLVAGWLVLMILVPALFGPLGRTAARWLERDGADVLQSLRAPQPAPRGWRAWLPTAGVLAPAFLMVTALLECAPVAAALGATTAATLARGTGALCLASGVLALARLARIGARMGRWKDPTLHAAAAVVLVASWSAQPLAVLRPERPQSQADTPASPVPAPGAGLAAIGAAINAAAAASSVSAASLPTDAASGPASAPSAEELEARAKAARILKDLLKPAATAPSAASMPTPRQAVPLLPAPNAPFNPAVQYASPVRPGVREIRTGPISVGRTGAFGPTTTVCAPLPPAGWKITDTSVKLSGDRECGRGSTCEIVVVDNGQTCAHFALQGSIEPPDKVPTFGMLRYRLDDNGNYEPMKN